MINNNTYKDDILLNHKNLAECDLSSKDYLIIMKIIKYCTICDIENEYGGQVARWTLDLDLEKEGISKNAVEYTFKKLIKNNIMIKNNEELYFQLNPYYIWIPSNPDRPSLSDKASLEYLKNKFTK